MVQTSAPGRHHLGQQRRGASEREVSTAITKLRREIEDVPVALEARGKKPAGLRH